MSNIGKEIKDFFCNGFAGRRYDLKGSIIEAEGDDWIVIRTDEGEPIFMNLQEQDKEKYVNDWTRFNYGEEL